MKKGFLVLVGLVAMPIIAAAPVPSVQKGNEKGRRASLQAVTKTKAKSVKSAAGRQGKLLATVAGGVSGATTAAITPKKSQEKDIYRWLQTYSEVISLIENKAFREVDFGQFIQDSLKAAVAHVDAHSAFFSKESYRSALESTSGEFSGIGVSIIGKTPEDEALVIIDVVEQGPARAAGLQAGDKIVEIGGEKLRGLSTDEVVAKLKGKVGSSLSLKVVRDKKPLRFKVKRDIIKDQTSTCYYFKNQSVYYLSLKVFNEKSVEQISELLAKANSGSCHGIVLDLRRNPGGLLEAAIEMAELFVEKDSLVVSTRNRERKVVREYKTAKEPQLKSEVPIFVLIDNFTASAAEILAGTLKYYSEHAKATRPLMVFLLGTSTFGKGSVQELIPIKNGCALKVTSMLYFLPGDSSIQAEGIAPDFLIKPKMLPTDEIKWINELYGKESSMKHFITKEEVNGKGRASKKKKNKKEDKSEGLWARWFGGSDSVTGDEEEDESSEGHEDASETKPEEEEDKRSFEEKQLEALVTDCQVQAAVNMINLLHFAKKVMPQAVNGRQKALTFLKQHYVTDELSGSVEKIR